jgi:hypothetical protein
VVEVKAKDWATIKHLAPFAAGTAAKKAAKTAAAAGVKPKPASAPPFETPHQLRARVRAALLRRSA